MPLFGFLKNKEKVGKTTISTASPGPPKPTWTDAWARSEVSLEEVQELLHALTAAIKSKGVDKPFWLLPFRLDSTISQQNSSKHFVRSFSQARFDRSPNYTGVALQQDLELSDLSVLASILRWVWSRIPGGVVTWEVYELFRMGEADSDMSKQAFDHFIPLSVDAARKSIIYDFFDLMATIAASSKTNGFGGRKLARFMGYYAFEFDDAGNGMEGGYRNWERAADATTHLFLAYLRSKTPENSRGAGGITDLPRALQSFLASTEYPPVTPTLLQTTTYKVLMIVDRVSPTPFSLLRRSKHFEYRDDMEALQDFSTFDDPVAALSDECRRVLNCVSSVNQTSAPLSTDKDSSWTRFEEIGFGHDFDPLAPAAREDAGAALPKTHKELQSLRSMSTTAIDTEGRPKTPSWGDFLSRGFLDGKGTVGNTPMLLHPDKQLPPIGERAHSSQSHMRRMDDDTLEPGELASITTLELDETFWWVWMTSLSGEETSKRKATFGRCCMLETNIPGARWLVVEEQVKGASPGPEEGAYIAEKKSKFSWTRRGRMTRRKSTGKKETPYNSRAKQSTTVSKTSIGPDQQAKIQAAAAELARKQRNQAELAQRRARKDEQASVKTNSVLTLQPAILSEAAPAMKWAKEFDKDTIRSRYLNDKSAGKGRALENIESNGAVTPVTNGNTSQIKALPAQPRVGRTDSPAQLPVTPPKEALAKETLAVEEAPSAANVPLPSPTPIEEKPASPTSEQPDLSQHPALRGQSSARPETPPPAEQKQSPPAKQIEKSPPKKLKKQSAGSGGFRNLFNRKKADRPSKPAAPKPAPSEAAAQSDALRSPSVVTTEEPPAAEPDDKLQSPVVARSPAIEQSAAVAAMSNLHDDYHAPSVHEEEPEPPRQFAQFSQGPLEDVPAFVPEDSDDDRSPTPQPIRRAAHQESYQEPISPPDSAAGLDADAISEASVELSHQQAIPMQERWAEIRRNAQERAQRMSEEKSHRSQQSQSVRTDDGETSGEETIEHRVARIKARVAELTGQMDTGNGRR